MSSGAMTLKKLRRLLGELLIERGLISAQELEQVLAEQQRTGELLGSILIRSGILSDTQLVAVLAEQAGIPYLESLSDQPIPPDVLAMVSSRFASQYHLVPLAFSGGTLQVAIADPFDIQTLDELKLLLNCNIHVVLTSPGEIQEAIQRYYGVGAATIEQLIDTKTYESVQVSRTEDLTATHDAASVISFVNQLILSAVRDRATDLHLEPFNQQLLIRERIDGVMYDMSVPADIMKLHRAIVSRLKVMAHLDIAERRLPQDGRMRVQLDGQELDLRISILPTNFGETVEIRILSPTMLYSLEQLGLGGDQLALLLSLLQKPHGIILVTGPTGSGKTTTLYACLSKLNTPHRKILTIEDPIEYQLPRITQLQVHPKIGFSFAQGLRSMLRHDPDIMMVGEVRDPETAEITIRSALTGHLVFSTLHTNDAAGGVTRLLEMGVEPFLVTSSVLCFIAQRLVRVVCSSCAIEQAANQELLREFEVTELPAALRVGRGCPLCKGTGYQGRTAIYEFLVVTDQIQQLILQRASSQEIALAAQRTGTMRTLRQDGWQKILQGVTTPQEVLRVT